MWLFGDLAKILTKKRADQSEKFDQKPSSKLNFILKFKSTISVVYI